MEISSSENIFDEQKFVESHREYLRGNLKFEKKIPYLQRYSVYAELKGGNICKNCYDFVEMGEFKCKSCGELLDNSGK